MPILWPLGWIVPWEQKKEAAQKSWRTSVNFTSVPIPTRVCPMKWEPTTRPEQMQAYIKEFVESQFVNIIGGCCGTTPDHIKAMAEAVKELKPRKLKLKNGFGHSGLEALVVEKIWILSTSGSAPM